MTDKLTSQMKLPNADKLTVEREKFLAYPLED